MDERDVIQRLENAKPPKVALPHARASLRRELVASPRFGGATWRFWPRLRMRLAFAAAVAMVVAIVMVVQLTPDRVSARSLVDAVGAAYDARGVPAAVHYVRQTLRLSDERHYEVQSWAQRGQRRARVRLTDLRSGEVLAHTVFDGDASYGLPGADSRVHGMADVVRGHPGVVHPPRTRVLAAVIRRVSEGDDWADETVLQALVLDNGFSQDAFESTTPEDVVHDLRKSDDVQYASAGNREGPDSGLRTLEIRNAGALPFELEFPMKHLDKVRWFLTSVISKDITFEMDGRFVEFLKEHGIEGEIALKPIETVQRIEIDPERARVRRATLIVLENGVETYRAVKTFLEDRFVPATPELFDPAALNLSRVEDTGAADAPGVLHVDHIRRRTATQRRSQEP